MPSPDRLFDLLPAWYRQRDAAQARDGHTAGPLQGFLRVVAEQVNDVEADIAGLYDNWFIDTCDDWVVPYLADLVGYEMVPEAGRPAGEDDPRGRLKNRFLVPRREVAHLIRYRRRKGSLAVLEQVARDVTGWPARAVEFGTLVGTFQHLSDVRLGRGRSIDTRNNQALELLGTPFDRVARSVDVRSPGRDETEARFNLPNVGLFVTRLSTFSVTDGDAHSIDPDGTFTFSALGNDTQLYIAAAPEEDPAYIAGPLNVPLPLTRLALDIVSPEGRHQAHEELYGEGRSVVVYEDGEPIPAARIVATNLAGWAYRPNGDTVALDPELGRIAFPPDAVPKSVRVTYHYAFPAEIGGGEYQRPVDVAPADIHFEAISSERESHNLLTAAVRRWQSSGRPHGIVEVTDSHVYSESSMRIELRAGQTLELRARSGTRPVLRVVDYQGSARDAIILSGGAAEPYADKAESGRGGCFVLQGIVVVGGGVDVRGNISAVTIRDCTLVPGWDLKADASPPRTTEPSLRFAESAPRVTIASSIVGPIRVEPLREHSEPIRVSIGDSILDALDRERDAVADPDAPFAYVDLAVRRSTVLGRVRVHALTLAEDSIFAGDVQVARRQSGCVRFCYVRPGSSTPRRFNCQPDLVVDELRRGSASPEDLAAAERNVRPVFASRVYGSRYCQLELTCPPEIRGGASDESEMGVYHDLFHPQREAVLRARLREYLPVGFVPALIFV
jgi:hypothetical protein